MHLASGRTRPIGNYPFAHDPILVVINCNTISNLLNNVAGALNKVERTVQGIQDKMQLELSSVSLVGAWVWDIPRDSPNARCAKPDEEDDEDDVCGICRNRYDGTCPSCEYPGNSCPLVLGTCHHNFHVHCIKQWLSTETSKGLCPLCRQGFQLRTNVLINEPHYEEFQRLLMNVRQQNIPMGTEVDQDMMDEGFIR